MTLLQSFIYSAPLKWKTVRGMPDGYRRCMRYQNPYDDINLDWIEYIPLYPEKNDAR